MTISMPPATRGRRLVNLATRRINVGITGRARARKRANFPRFPSGLARPARYQCKRITTRGKKPFPPRNSFVVSGSRALLPRARVSDRLVRGVHAQMYTGRRGVLSRNFPTDPGDARGVHLLLANIMNEHPIVIAPQVI